LRGVITPVTHGLDVSLLVVRGQTSRTAIYEAACRFGQKIQQGKKCHLCYFGDFDPSGLSIYDSLVDRISNFNPLHGPLFGINFQRIALTQQQISDFSLPQDPAKQSDPNYRRFVTQHGDNVVELDSLPPDELRNLIKDSIEARIDDNLLAQVQKTEKQEQKKLIRFIDKL